MKTQNWLNTLQNDKAKKIARAWFREYNNQEGITKEFNPEAYNRWLKRTDEKKTPRYVLPLVNYYFQVWKKFGFFDKSRPLREVQHMLTEEGRKRLKYLPANYSLFLLNLEPIYKFCKEKGIEFSEEEKSFLKLSLLPDHIRKEILEEYPKEDIINATLKYYAKNCILKYFYLLREIRENPEKYKKERAEAEELNNPKDEARKEMKKTAEKILDDLDKQLGLKHTLNKIEFDEIKVIAYAFPTTPSTSLFRDYLGRLEDEREMVLSVDKKVLSALEMYPEVNVALKIKIREMLKKRCPSDKSKRYNAPAGIRTRV